jgi:hypothetical protein
MASARKEMVRGLIEEWRVTPRRRRARSLSVAFRFLYSTSFKPGRSPSGRQQKQRESAGMHPGTGPKNRSSAQATRCVKRARRFASSRLCALAPPLLAHSNPTLNFPAQRRVSF